jgi:predicted nucleic acid-binding protein
VLADIVIDTNVLVHASSPTVAYQQAALLLLNALELGSTALCVDEGFDVVEARNRSLIGGEYYENLVTGMIGFAIVATLANTGRLSQVSKRVPTHVAARIRRLVPRKPRDRTFVHVAINAKEHILVSHDFDDFGPSVRSKLLSAVEVEVVTAYDAIPLIRS